MSQDVPVRKHLRRLTRTAVATTAVALATSTVAAPAYAVDRDRDRSKATSWLVTQLHDGRFHNKQFDSDDWGLTVDGLFALVADPHRAQAAARVAHAVRRHVDDYAAPKQGERYAGALAKSLLAAEVLDADPRDFGGRDLRHDVLNRVDRKGAETGRLKDRSKYGDNSNTITQAYGVIALARSGGVPRSSVRFLLKQRCKGGFFRLQMTRGSTCDGDASAPSVDATALGIQALEAADRYGPGVRDGLVTRSGRWLAERARPNGSLGGDPGTSRGNTNSTGLAAQALALTWHGKAVRKAARWVDHLQATRPKADSGPAARELGALAYNRDGLLQGLDEGVTRKTRDQFRRATTQAVFALKPVSFVDLTRS